MLLVIQRECDLPAQVVTDFAQGEYLHREFFRLPRVRCCLWKVEDRCVSLLRLEPWGDGMLLTGLETLPSERNQGYASALITAVGEYLGRQGAVRLYSHIDHRNKASIRTHEKCGFRLRSDTARLLDGTVTTRMGTYLLECYA